MTDEPPEVDTQRKLSSLPARALSEAEVEALSEESGEVDLSPASIRVSDPPEVTSVFVEQAGAQRRRHARAHRLSRRAAGRGGA